MSTLLSFRANAASIDRAGATENDQANSEREGSRRQQSSPRFIAHLECKSPSVTSSGCFDAALHAGLRRPLPIAEERATLRFVTGVLGRFVHQVFSSIAAGMRTMRRPWLERRIAATLERLDDTILKDIGICRSEIPHVARTQASGKWRM
jgi:uncharacterized protein YjiS (DUF1127 family)